MTKYFVLFLCMIYFVGNSFSQTEDNDQHFYLSSRAFYGTIMPHHPEIGCLIDGRVRSYELSFGVHTSGKRKWEQAHKYPSIGVGYMYSDFGNQKIFGVSHSFFAFINSSLYQKNRYSLRYNFQLGIAYLNKPFDQDNNHLNFVIGTPFNIHANLLIENRYRVSNRIELFAGFGLYHFSNGGTKQPNLGINVLNISGGFSYLLNSSPIKYIKSDFPKTKKKIDFFILQTIGAKADDPAGEQKYLVSILHFNAGKQFGQKYRLGAGTDIIFNTKNKRLRNDSTLDVTISKKEYYAGIHLSNDIIFGKLYFTIQQGVYFYKDSGYYNRFGFRYVFGKHIAAGLSLYTHAFNAKNIEAGIGFYF
jgi:hypothetical protein